MPALLFHLVRPLSAVLALAWMIVLYQLSAQSSVSMPLDFPGEDKLYHAIAYGLLGALYLFSLAPHRTGFSRRQALLAALLAVLYGLSDEWHQGFVPGRVTDPLDVLADASGALLFAFAARWLSRGWYPPAVA
ncbi:VanZ family protein [Thiohalobacter sp. IOR34]|uniref:VanZ family protein n=1 Tax=Thiohalobacter sp. IOR34 TaxID=3057176 RepID=UPI0025B0A53F|nr:VanZ family protein [Thiohalobacter sp. IOR34]WJW75216.1 VanZ family protein [Thiohalobacter sp. IOR34]